MEKSRFSIGLGSGALEGGRGTGGAGRGDEKEGTWPRAPDTLTSMNDLASTDRKQGRSKEAEELEVHVMQCSQAA